MPASTVTNAPDTEELAQFRQRWREEIKERSQPYSSPNGPSKTEGQQFATESGRLKSALELYSNAVLEEQRRNYPEATRLYRDAFRCDPNVDRAYRREELLHQRQPLAASSISLVGTLANLSLEHKGTQGDRGLYESHSLHSIVKTWPVNVAFVPANEAYGVPLVLLNDLDWFAGGQGYSPWILLCGVELIMSPPQLGIHELSMEEVAHRYHSDFRRMYIEHPRLRFDGIYISICYYIRNGLGDNPWVTVSHLITYRRFLRFLPSGKVLSYRANEDQDISDVVHSLQPGLRRKDLCVGDWQLSGTTVLVTNLTDVVLQEHAVPEKYNFQMVLGLKSRPGLGRWNKLDILQYESINLETGEVNSLSLRNERSYWFSKVRSYRLEAF